MNLGRKPLALVLALAAVWVGTASGCGISSGCVDGDRVFADGDSWICSDGCNRCGCVDGEFVTTAMACGFPPEPEGDGGAGAGDSVEARK